MRWLACFFLLLTAVAWLACEIRLPETATATGASLDSWRRTRDGWEHASWLTPPTPSPAPTLHPAVVGLLELFLSLAALVAFPACIASTKAQNAAAPCSRCKRCAATRRLEQRVPPISGVRV
jgi:hypothetical protein